MKQRWDKVLVTMPVTWDCSLTLLRKPTGNLAPRGHDGEANLGCPLGLHMIRVTQLGEYIIVHQSHN